MESPEREAGREHGPIDRRLYLLFTPSACVADPWRTLDAAVAGGVDLVQWRVKSASDRDLYPLFVDACRRLDVPWIVNDDVDLAVASGAAGAHVGQTDMPARAARERLGPGRWLGVSTHDPEEIAGALAAGADHLGFGPMFRTVTKGYEHGQPRGALTAALRQAGALPIFAIGGIDPDNVPRVGEEGGRRIAVSAAILRARDPHDAAARLRASLDRAAAT